MWNIFMFLSRLPLFLAAVAAITLIGAPVLILLGLGYLLVNVAWLIVISPLVVLSVAIRKELKHLGSYFKGACDFITGPRQCLELLGILYASMINWMVEAKS